MLPVVSVQGVSLALSALPIYTHPYDTSLHNYALDGLLGVPRIQGACTETLFLSSHLRSYQRLTHPSQGKHNLGLTGTIGGARV